jgi:hypothetical protein
MNVRWKWLKLSEKFWQFSRSFACFFKLRDYCKPSSDSALPPVPAITQKTQKIARFSPAALSFCDLITSNIGLETILHDWNVTFIMHRRSDSIAMAHTKKNRRRNPPRAVPTRYA